MASMQNQNDVEFFNARTRKISNCEHSYIVSNWSKTEKSQNATQYICQKCQILMSMEVITQQHAKYLEFLVRSQNPET